MNEAEFPAPIRLNGRIFFDDHELENYKRRLLGLPELPRYLSAKIKLRAVNLSSWSSPPEFVVAPSAAGSPGAPSSPTPLSNSAH